MEKLATGYGLIEGPVYLPGEGLLFSDVLGGGVYRLDLETGQIETVVAHRRGIGGMAPDRRGDLVRLGPRAMLGGAMGCWMTACIAGTLAL